MKRKATIYDYNRFCKSQKDNCSGCPLFETSCILDGVDEENLDFINNVVLTWCDEHPVKTKLDEFKEFYPYVTVKSDFDIEKQYIDICPIYVDSRLRFSSQKGFCSNFKSNCQLCKINYWNQEVKK